ncbi:GMC family oxidoreductase [Colwelliaceae bacterium BS250]
MQKEFDFIIIGGGSSGCVLANKLSACGKYSVCLVERGGDNDSALVTTPIGTAVLMRLKKFNYSLNSTPQPQQNNRQIYNPRGKGLGGSSAINAMLYTRGQKHDYDDWAALGNNGWSYDEVLPYFIDTEHQERIKSDYHGCKGGLNVADSRSANPLGANFVQAGLNAGYAFNADFNGEQQSGVGYYQVTQKNGKRCSAAAAFLEPIKSRQNLTIITHAKIDKIVITDKVIHGVQYWHKQTKYTLTANKEVILSAGAIHSPQILMLSGIGSKDELDKHNIKLEHELSGVGKNLQDHVDAIIVNKHKAKNLITIKPDTIIPMVKELHRFIRHKTGLLTTSVVESGGFVSLDNKHSRPDIQWQLVAAAMDDHGRNLKMFFERGISMHVCLLRPKSHGEITLLDASIDSSPLINSNMLSHPDDINDMVKAVRLTRDVLKQSPLKQQHISEIFPGEDVQTDVQIIEFLKAKSNNIYHPVGTCKMGNDKLAVVDSTLKVHGLSGLRVVDASIMPNIVSANTNAPCIMIGAKAADMILQQYSN